MNRRSNPARILVVDDDPDTVDILSRHLQREGFVAIEAFCGADCLQIAGASEVDVILLDLMMPGMDGYAFRAEQLRTPAISDVPVVVLTAGAAPRATELGSVDILKKPVDLVALLDVVGRNT